MFKTTNRGGIRWLFNLEAKRSGDALKLKIQTPGLSFLPGQSEKLTQTRSSRRNGKTKAPGFFNSLAGRQFPGLKGSAVGCLRNCQPLGLQRGCFAEKGGGIVEEGWGVHLVGGWHGTDTDSFQTLAVAARPC